jgi:hypothetical protein
MLQNKGGPPTPDLFIHLYPAGYFRRPQLSAHTFKRRNPKPTMTSTFDSAGTIPALLDYIAGNTTLVAKSVRQLTDDDASDWLALAALVFACFAFIVALFQAVLEYSQASPTRQKCSYAAIGIARRYTTRHWSFREWRWKYQYPRVSFEDGAFLKALQNSETGYDLQRSSFYEALRGSEPFGGRLSTGKFLEEDIPSNFRELVWYVHDSFHH